MESVTFLHNVFFWLKNPTKEEDLELFETALKKFILNSKFIKTSFLGTPAKKERAIVDDSYTYSLVVGFTSKEKHDAYQIEEAHLLFIKEAYHLWKRVMIYDSENVL